MNFEEYLSSKKIDSDAFRNAEPVVWESWKTELEQMHPNSFTIQKLNLINPVRRKYPLKQGNKEQGVSSKESAFAKASEDKQEVKTVADTNPQTAAPPSQTTPPATKPGVARPVFKPKPKIN